MALFSPLMGAVLVMVVSNMTFSESSLFILPVNSVNYTVSFKSAWCKPGQGSGLWSEDGSLQQHGVCSYRDSYTTQMQGIVGQV